ncbi:MAG: leucine-rich repeat domain-containing protein [Methylococcales bacterium]
MRHCFKLFFTLALLTGSCQVNAAIPSTERDALVALYNSTNGANWINKTGWLGAAGTECSWYGIFCGGAGNNVLSLNLGGNQLSGSIPAALGNLAQLQTLRLNNNQLNGTIPVTLGNLTQLLQFSLFDNQVTGTIPAELANLMQLQRLDLGFNQLSGSIPVAFGQLTQLQYIHLGSNQLTGSVPASLGNLTQLQNLSLHYNQLSGVLPTELGNLLQLQSLFLHGNQLSGAIPASIGQLAQLLNLQLNNNQFSGTIPAELGKLTQLQNLRLDKNQLSGSIPSSLGQLSQLQYFYLKNNQLTGSIPIELGNLPQLLGLYLESNQLSGSIPASLGNLAQLQTLLLDYNQFSGSIPAALGNLSQLQTLMLNNNQLSGMIPTTLGQLSQLQYLYLSNNQLSGSIPNELGNLAKLVYFDLSRNQLSGIIPGTLTKLTNIGAGAGYLYLENNNCLTTSDSVLITYLDQKDPAWRIQTCPTPTPPITTLIPTPTATQKPTSTPTLTLTPAPTLISTPTLAPITTVTAAPVPTLTKPPSFSLSPSRGVVPLSVTLDASGFIDSASYQWRAELEVVATKALMSAKAAQIQQATGKLTSMTFNDPGTFIVTLTAVDIQGKSITATQKVVIENAPKTSANALSLLVNIPEPERALESNKIDWYNFYAQKGVIYKLEVLVGAQIDPQVELFDAADHSLATLTTRTGESILVQGSLPVDGYYKLKITNKNPIATRSLSKPSSDYHYALQVLLLDSPKTVIGKIRNSCTGNPLYDVKISVASDPSSYTASLNDGEFSLPINPQTVKKQYARSIGRIFFRRNDFNEIDYPINTDALNNIDIQLTPASGCETAKAKALFNCATQQYSNNFYNPKERYAEGRFIRDYVSGWSLVISKDDQGFAYKAPDMPDYNAQYSLDFINELHCKPKGVGY